MYIVTSPQKDTSKICDITGETIVQTGRWQRNWICAPVNLEKAFILAWPAVSVFPDIQKKYATWNLPTLYLLDKEKKIVAKRLKAEDLPDLIKAIFAEDK